MGRRQAWDAERKELLMRLANRSPPTGGGGRASLSNLSVGAGGAPHSGAPPATPATDGFTGVANNLLRGLFSKNSEPPPPPSASNWPI